MVWMLSVCPTLGVVLSNILFLAPNWAVRVATSQQQIGNLNPVPYAVMVLASFQWTSYGMCIQNGCTWPCTPRVCVAYPVAIRSYIVASNLPGFCLSLWYLLEVLPLVTDTRKRLIVNVVVGAFVSLHACCLYDRIVQISGTLATGLEWSWLVLYR